MYLARRLVWLSMPVRVALLSRQDQYNKRVQSRVFFRESMPANRQKISTTRPTHIHIHSGIGGLVIHVARLEHESTTMHHHINAPQTTDVEFVPSELELRILLNA